MRKVEFKNIYKVFGSEANRGLEFIQEGMSKQELLEKHGLTLGINNISLNILEGQFFVIMGLSGSGKSTLVRHLNRLIDATSGEVRVDGKNVRDFNQDELIRFRRSKVSMVFQKFALLPHRSVFQNVCFGLEVRGENKNVFQAKVKEWIKVVGLEGYENSFPRELSGGMQQRVGLARALAVETDILIMDEPFSALDPLIRTEMQDLMLELKEKYKKTIIFVTHDIEEAQKLADEMAILKDGEIIQVGKPQEFIDNPANGYVKKFFEKYN